MKPKPDADDVKGPLHWMGRRAFGETLMVSVALTLFSVATGVLTARLLGPEGRGALALAIAVSAMIGAALGPGVAQAFTVRIADRREQASMAVGLSVWSGLLVAITVTATGWFVTSQVVVDPQSTRTIQIGLLAVPASVTGVCLAGVLRGLRLGRQFNITRLLAPATYGMGMALLALTARITVEAVLMAYVAGIAASTIVAFALIPRGLRDLKTVSVPFAKWAYRYGAAASLSGVAIAVKLQLAIPVLAATATAKEVGFYAVALSYAIPVGIIATSIAIHTLPDVAAARGASRLELVRRRQRTNIASLALMGGLAVVAAPFLIPLAFGREFAPAVHAAQLLVLAQVAASMTLVQAEISRALGRPGIASVAEGTGIAGTVALLFIFVPTFKTAGAASVGLAVNVGVAILLGYLLRRELKRLAAPK